MGFFSHLLGTEDNAPQYPIVRQTEKYVTYFWGEITQKSTTNTPLHTNIFVFNIPVNIVCLQEAEYSFLFETNEKAWDLYQITIRGSYIIIDLKKDKVSKHTRFIPPLTIYYKGPIVFLSLEGEGNLFVDKWEANDKFCIISKGNFDITIGEVIAHEIQISAKGRGKYEIKKIFSKISIVTCDGSYRGKVCNIDSNKVNIYTSDQGELHIDSIECSDFHLSSSCMGDCILKKVVTSNRAEISCTWGHVNFIKIKCPYLNIYTKTSMTLDVETDFLEIKAEGIASFVDITGIARKLAITENQFAIKNVKYDRLVVKENMTKIVK